MTCPSYTQRPFAPTSRWALSWAQHSCISKRRDATMSEGGSGRRCIAPTCVIIQLCKTITHGQTVRTEPGLTTSTQQHACTSDWSLKGRIPVQIAQIKMPATAGEATVSSWWCVLYGCVFAVARQTKRPKARGAQAKAGIRHCSGLRVCSKTLVKRSGREAKQMCGMYVTLCDVEGCRSAVILAWGWREIGGWQPVGA